MEAGQRDKNKNADEQEARLEALVRPSLFAERAVARYYQILFVAFASLIIHCVNTLAVLTPREAEGGGGIELLCRLVRHLARTAAGGTADHCEEGLW